MMDPLAWFRCPNKRCRKKLLRFSLTPGSVVHIPCPYCNEYCVLPRDVVPENSGNPVSGIPVLRKAEIHSR